MEIRLNRKIKTHSQSFKNDIKNKMNLLGLLEQTQGKELLQYIYDYSIIEITKMDLQKRKRVRIVYLSAKDAVLLELITNSVPGEKKQGKNFAVHILKARLMAKLPPENKLSILL